jgi:hypothetical protein
LVRDLLRRWKPGLAEGLAFVLLLVAAGAIILYDRRELRAWDPNIVVSAISIAITITVVSWIVRREARERIRPRVERTLYWMGLSFSSFLSAIITDYSGTHYKTFKPIPGTASEMLDLWLAEQENEDVARRLLDGESLPMLVLEAREFTRTLEEHRARDLDVLEADVVTAIDDFGWHTGQAVQLLDMVDQGLLDDQARTEGTALATVIQGTQKFVAAFEQYDPRWMRIRELSKASAAVHSRRNGEAQVDEPHGTARV